MGTLTLWGDYIFDGWIPPPPERYPINILRLRMPSGLTENERACADAGDDIIHAYVRLLYDMTPTSKDDSYRNERSTDRRTEHQSARRATLPRLRHEGQFPIRERHEKLAITW